VPAAAFQLLSVGGIEPSQEVLRRRFVLEVVAGQTTPHGRRPIAFHLIVERRLEVFFDPPPPLL